MTDKIEPCAWCGEMPSSSRHGEYLYYFCDNQNCVFGDITGDVWAVAAWRDAWNKRQSDIVAQRRKDFLSGYWIGSDTLPSWDEHCEIDWDKCRKWIDSLTPEYWFVSDPFEEYIKGQK